METVHNGEVVLSVGVVDADSCRVSGLDQLLWECCVLFM